MTHHSKGNVISICQLIFLSIAPYSSHDQLSQLFAATRNCPFRRVRLEQAKICGHLPLLTLGRGSTIVNIILGNNSLFEFFQRQ